METKFAKHDDFVLCGMLADVLRKEHGQRNITILFNARKTPQVWGYLMNSDQPYTKDLVNLLEEVIQRGYTRAEFVWFSNPNNFGKSVEIEISVKVLDGTLDREINL
jgi:hypothetical protein